MKNYILKLTSGTTYKLYDGTTLVSDTALTTLFATAGSAYLSFDFDGNTPTATDELTITNSSDTAVITNTGLTDAIEENKNYKVAWSANATAFDTFEVLEGVTMDESQLSTLMGKVKNAREFVTLTSADYSAYGDGTKIQMWKLPVGFYKIAHGTKFQVGTQNPHSGIKTARKGDWVIISYGNTTTNKALIGSMDESFEVSVANLSDTGYNASDDGGALISTSSIKNNLTTSTTSNIPYVLDARQGKVLNDKILGASGTVAAWTAIGTGSSYTKRALQVTLNISETGLTIPADTWTSLGITMPTGFIPTITMLSSVTANNNGTFEAGLIRVNTDGTVEVHASNATTDIYGSIVFPVAS